MLDAAVAQSKALISTDSEIRRIVSMIKKPDTFDTYTWNTLKRVANNLEPLQRNDFTILKELCKVLKVFHVETCRVVFKNIFHLQWNNLDGIRTIDLFHLRTYDYDGP